MSSINTAQWWGYTTISPTLKTMCCFHLSRGPEYHGGPTTHDSTVPVCAGQRLAGGRRRLVDLLTRRPGTCNARGSRGLRATLVQASTRPRRVLDEEHHAAARLTPVHRPVTITLRVRP